MENQVTVHPVHKEFIYLDDSSHAVKVQGNTIINTDLGILIHNGYDNELTQNTVYGARSASVNISESVLVPRLTVKNNTVKTNLFFPTKASATYRLYGAYDNNNFGTYNLNRYSSLYSTQLVNEDYKPGGVPTNAQFTLAGWQQKNVSTFPGLQT